MTRSDMETVILTYFSSNMAWEDSATTLFYRKKVEISFFKSTFRQRSIIELITEILDKIRNQNLYASAIKDAVVGISKIVGICGLLQKKY